MSRSAVKLGWPVPGSNDFHHDTTFLYRETIGTKKVGAKGIPSYAMCYLELFDLFRRSIRKSYLPPNPADMIRIMEKLKPGVYLQ